jgi:hypothetical protein
MALFAKAHVRPLTPALSPEYRGEGVSEQSLVRLVNPNKEHSFDFASDVPVLILFLSSGASDAVESGIGNQRGGLRLFFAFSDASPAKSFGTRRAIRPARAGG